MSQFICKTIMIKLEAKQTLGTCAGPDAPSDALSLAPTPNLLRILLNRGLATRLRTQLCTFSTMAARDGSDSSTDDEAAVVRFRVARPAPAKRPSADASDGADSPVKRAKPGESFDAEETQPEPVIRRPADETQVPPGWQDPREALEEDKQEVRTEHVPSSPLQSPRASRAGSPAREERFRVAVPTLGLHSAESCNVSKADLVDTSLPIVVAFLASHKNVDVVLCEPDEETFGVWQNAIAGDRSATELADLRRFVLLPNDIAEVCTQGGAGNVDAAVCEVTWRAKPASDASRELCDLATKDDDEGGSTLASLMQDVKSKFAGGVAKIGIVQLAEVRGSSILRVREGIRSLLFACTTLNCGIEVDGKPGGNVIEDPHQVLKTSWLAVLSVFAKEFAHAPQAPPKNAFAVLMDAAKQKSHALKTQSDALPSGPRLVTKPPPAYLEVLRKYITNPEKQLQTEWHDDEIVIIADDYPKSMRHYLVLPRNLHIDRIAQLKPADLPVLERMKAEAARFIKPILKAHPKFEFMMGFHAVPSLNCLHLHVLTTDFRGQSLKNKKHWNSFNTKFFRPIDDVIRELREKGKVEIKVKEMEQLLKADMVCARHGNFKLRDMREVENVSFTVVARSCVITDVAWNISMFLPIIDTTCTSSPMEESLSDIMKNNNS